MKIFVISLRTAGVRRAEASEQMSKCGVPFEFFDAVEGGAGLSDWFAGIDPRVFRLNTRRYDPTPGEIGCYASHLSLWKWAISHDQPVVILEDDFQLEPGFAENINDLEPLVNEFGFIRLQSMHGPRALLKRLRPAAREVVRRNGLSVHYLSDPPLYALAYAISPEAARTLTRASATLFAPVDKFLQHTWIHETPIYALSPALVTMSPQAEHSTIGGRRGKRHQPVRPARPHDLQGYRRIPPIRLRPETTRPDLGFPQDRRNQPANLARTDLSVQQVAVEYLRQPCRSLGSTAKPSVRKIEVGIRIRLVREGEVPPLLGVEVVPMRGHHVL